MNIYNDTTAMTRDTQEANRIAAALRGHGSTPVKVCVPRMRRPVIVRAGRKLVQPEAVLQFLYDYFAENDQLPLPGATAEHFGIKTQTAHEHMLRLEAAGAIERNAAGKWRFARTGEAA